MTVKRGGLGRNLSALLSHVDVVKNIEQKASELLSLPINHLQPGKYQPRGEIDDNGLVELSESIKKQGLLQPLVVRQLAAENYEIIAGERRWRACQLAGMTEIPVILRQVDDETAMAIALVENLQREDLNAMDQARAMYRLTTEFALTHLQVAELLSKSRTAVSNYLRLLNLSHDVKRMLENGDLDMGHARSLLMLGEDEQNHIAQLVVAKQLSVRETEVLVAKVKSHGVETLTANPSPDISPLYKAQLNYLSNHLQTKVKLKHGKANKGTLVIHYNDMPMLEKMIDLLTNNLN